MGIAGEEADSPVSRATVHLLGSPCVTSLGSRMQIPEGSKRLLAFVALHRDGVERRYVAGSLWPVGGDDRAAGNLRSALWRLRGAGIEIVECDKWSLRLAQDVEVDVETTLDWADRVIHDRAHDHDLRIHPDTVHALDLLPGWYDDWTIVVRERLRQRMLHAFETLSAKLIGIGRYADAVEAAITAVNAEPLRESAHRALIEVHLAECNWVEAHRSFIIFQNLIRRELGIDPSHEICALLFGPTHRTSHNRDPRSIGRSASNGTRVLVKSGPTLGRPMGTPVRDKPAATAHGSI